LRGGDLTVAAPALPERESLLVTSGPERHWTWQVAGRTLPAVTIHPAAAQGFSRASGAYERGRPDYPEAALDLLAAQAGLRSGARVLDLGAGTGKLTRQLLGRGARPLALEPLLAMARACLAAAPGVPVVQARAEALPLADGSCELVVAAQACHWFDAPRALAEAARVLRPGAALALIWNTRDESVPWVARFSEVVHWHRRDVPRYVQDGELEATVAASGRFGPVARHAVPHAQPLTRALLVDRAASISYVAALDERERGRVLDAVRSLAAGLPEEFELPYRTDVYLARRR